MGCWDIFCLICGNTCHSMFPDSVEFFLDEIKFYNSHKNSKKYNHIKNLKKWNDKYNYDKSILSKIKNLIKTTAWMNKCTMLTAANEIIHNCKEVSCNITFVDKNNNSYEHDPFGNFKDMNMSYGVFVHTDCWKFIYEHYGIKLKYGDLPIFPSKNHYKVIDFINYGKIEKYWSQDFDFISTIIDGNEYLCTSPLLKDKNISIIKTNFSKLKIRQDRPSPRISATFFKNNTYKIGENKNIWVSKNNKWIEIKDKLVEYDIEYPLTKLSNSKFISNLKYIGETNSKPIFIKNIINKNKQIIKITYIKIELG